MNESPDCTICPRQLWEDEAGRFACQLCEQRIDRHLRSLAGPCGLYARLCLRNEPGAPSGGPRVTGSASAAIAGSLSVLDMTADGGIVSVLEGWVKDWSSYGLGIQGGGGRLQYRVDRAVETLRRNLPQACLRHPALDAFADEIRGIAQRCETIIGGGKPPTQFEFTCSCSRTVRFDITTPGITCPGCQTSYGIEEIRQAAKEQRAAA